MENTTTRATLEAKTERNYGFAHAEYLDEHGIDLRPMPMIKVIGCKNKVSFQTYPIPRDEYTKMVADGIQNPSPEEFWGGYDDNCKTKTDWTYSGLRAWTPRYLD